MAVNIYDAKTQLSKLVDQAAAGQGCRYCAGRETGGSYHPS